MKIVICIGSACHMKGSKAVVEQLQQLIAENNLKDVIDLSGICCMGKCGSSGVNVMVNGKYFTVSPETTKNFFDNEVLRRLPMMDR